MYFKYKVSKIITLYLILTRQGILHLWQLCATMMSWVGCFTNRLIATRYMKVKRMGITEILRKIWLFSANKIKSSESFSKQQTQFIVNLKSSLQHILAILDNTYRELLSQIHPHKRTHDPKQMLDCPWSILW